MTFSTVAAAVVVSLGTLFATASTFNQMYQSKEAKTMNDVAKAEASRSSDDMEKWYEKLQALFRQIKPNRAVLEARIKPMEDLIVDRNKESRDCIFHLETDT